MKLIAYALLISLIVLPGIFANTLSATATEDIEASYSFENDFEGWTIHATQLNPDLPPPITLSQERAKDGATSLKFLVNRDDSFQFIWIERVFEVEPNQVYDVDIDYALATAECCSNPFSNVAGVLKKTPETVNDFVSALQDIVGTGEDTVVGYKWVDKRYAVTTRSDEQGKFHLIIGFFGSDPVRRIEYIDGVHLKIVKRAEPCEFFSFEQDLEGWMPEAIDVGASDGGFTEWSIAPSSQGARDGEHCLRFFTTKSNEDAKVFIIRPFAVERKKKYQVKVEYEFVNGSLASGARIITGVLRAKPETGDELIRMYQEKALKFPEVYGWQRKQYEFTMRSKKRDVLYVAIGIAAKNSGHHLYQFDNICVTLSAK